MRFISFVLAAAAVAVPAAAQRPAPAGTLISADPMTDTPDGMQAWKVRYWTTTAQSQPIAVTGIVVAPREAIPAQPRKVVAWTHGAWGVASKCAPSLSANFWKATPGLEAVKRGYVVVAPDYPGLDSPGVHPFLVGPDTARSVLDAVRSARSIPGAAAGSRFAVWGESQGGHAALWTAQRARAYAPDLTIVGVAAAAPPTDLLSNLAQAQNKTVRALFMAFIGDTWSKFYGAPLATFGNAQTQGIVTRLAQNNCIQLSAKPKLSTILGILTVQNRWRNLDLSRQSPWNALARRNSPTTTNIGMPMLLSQGDKDELVSPAVTRAHARALCRSGNRVRWLPIAGGSHIVAASAVAGPTVDWIDQRFQGRPAPSDCGRF